MFTRNQFTEKFGQNIQKRRKNLGLSQSELAEKIDIGQQAMSGIERGENAPRFDRLPIIAQELHCSVADLFRLPELEDTSIQDKIIDVIRTLSLEEQKYILQVVSGMSQFFSIHKTEQSTI